MDNNYQLSRIHNYINGLMSKEDMYAFEHEALDDPFLQDAIDGYKLQHGIDVKQISLLQQRLVTRVEKQGSERNKRYYSWQRLTIALAAGVMFVVACSLILLRFIPNKTEVASKEVLVSDAMYELSVITLKASNNAYPEGDWEAFQQLLNTSYANSQNYVGTLDIRFEINENKQAFNIKIDGKDFSEDEELKDIIRNKVKWNGTEAGFLLNIKKIGL